MQNLNLDTFNPKKAELQTLSAKYKSLTIKGVDDKDGYKAVDAARKELKTTRVDLKKKGKEMRDEANQFSKNVIKLEKELVWEIEPMEKELKEKQEAIDELVKIEKRKEGLPARRERLAEIWVEISDEENLAMDWDEFSNFFADKKMEWLEERERKIKEAEEKAAEEKRIVEEKEAEKKREEERKKELAEAEKRAAEEAKKEAERKAREKIAKAKQDKVNAQEKAKQEKVRAEFEKARIEKEHKAEIAKIKEDAEKKKKMEEYEAKMKKAQEEVEKEKAEKRVEYIKLRTSLWYTEKNKHEFEERQVWDWKFEIWRKLWEFKI